MMLLSKPLLESTSQKRIFMWVAQVAVCKVGSKGNAEGGGVRSLWDYAPDRAFATRLSPKGPIVSAYAIVSGARCKLAVRRMIRVIQETWDRFW
jgi:hypothetical protein